MKRLFKDLKMYFGGKEVRPVPVSAITFTLGPGEWRCRCMAEPGFDASVNPSYISGCARCGALRPEENE